MPDNVTPLRTSPPITDIPGQLRQMADDLESGRVEMPDSALFIINRPKAAWPDIFGWGDHMGDIGNVGLLEYAKAFFVHNLTKRSAGD